MFRITEVILAVGFFIAKNQSSQTNAAVWWVWIWGREMAPVRQI